jgi:hypothetical protein
VIRGPRTAAPVARKLIARKSLVLETLAAQVSALGGEVIQAVTWRHRYDALVARRGRAGYSRPMSERLAWGEVIEDWLTDNPVLDADGCCAGCSGPERGETLRLPDGRWVHFPDDRRFECLIHYGIARSRRAAAALVSLGITPPPNSASIDDWR